jgi:quercetin dioxygenase-like cupin family protein
VVVLEGGLEVTSSQGEVRQLTAGSMILVEDLPGAGHKTRTVGDDPCVFVAVSGADSA